MEAEVGAGGADGDEKFAGLDDAAVGAVDELAVTGGELAARLEIAEKRTTDGGKR